MDQFQMTLQSIIDSYKSSVTKLCTDSMLKRITASLDTVMALVASTEPPGKPSDGSTSSDALVVLRNAQAVTASFSLALSSLHQLFDTLAQERQAFIKNAALVNQKALIAVDQTQTKMDQNLEVSVGNLVNSVLMTGGSQTMIAPKVKIRSQDDLMTIDTSAFEAWLDNFAAAFR
ncbi:hypothetical protein [Thalassospira sp.]|uniref:hypothetical protein n=1 Tax=Thalassospira sp. TaxID=1912094 RepID=UPI0027350103|nr:hypothetical protein [Thalassospira sp.]MDP2698655.1 hypothetical protein [Thalassospira sp.]